ncbi:SMR family transporter [Marinobacter adhaerens]|uniref:QacE family quaternary ammonium compound efflux SMR transporter n=3 Tax=Marinobacter adhaerens TaxID=1033846 RepID=A0ABX8ILR0_9GAMM|nr:MULTISPECIES: SMR family transporter [Marinobacter]MCR9189421.1 SMR family transporter [Alteromonadaceae bacterium]MTI76456.1 QacE family quaternary ammonium compound efflux SMR transporter [Marinobacter sp.]ADP96722.1 small multidrug resistance protein [Marinobacter adhaerens HP15]AKV97508.1 multidrug transporter [Marinobacter sp. CP1]MBW3227760.1 QacE family quaternary ammonium compound efflux SMR transporter [Marinobacter adhaerens]
MKSWIFLGVAIVAEVIATTGLKASEGFTRLWPSLLVIAGYTIAFYFLSLTLKEIPVGVAYAIWAGMGVVLVALIGWLIYGQALDAATVIGMALIITGVAVINLFSKSVAH